MDKTPLYQEIAESIRQEILYGTLNPDDELPTVRDMSEQWGCAPGTVQRAYQELAKQGLIVSRPGAGTRVAAGAAEQAHTPLRRATLINQAESFLLSALASSYTLEEIEQAVHFAMDRWRAVTSQPQPDAPAQVLRFVGSHDPAISLLADTFAERAPGYGMHLSFAGSLGGLMALARAETDIAGCHLWDEVTDSYNRPFVQRLLPGRQMVLLTLADRRLGLLAAPGNPHDIAGLGDLPRGDLRFINRQRGSGTRVWLDAHLQRLGIEPDEVHGYSAEVHTHAEVAGAVSEGRADVGLGIETAAITYGLAFVPLTTERYDLVIPREQWNTPPVQSIAAALASKELKNAIQRMGGYDVSRTGQFERVG